DYVLVLFVGSLFITANYSIGQLLRSEGSTFYSMVGMVAGTVINIVLDPIFIFSFDLGVMGAAIATVLSNAIALAISLYYYIFKKTLLRPSLKMLKMDGQIVGEIMKVGIPHTLEHLLATAAFIVNNNLAAAYGDNALAAMGVANKIMSFGNYTYQGMAAGCQPLMGYNYGAKDFVRVQQIIKSGIIITTAIELVIIAIFWICAPFFISLFSSDAAVIDIGAKTLRAFSLALIFIPTTSIIRNAFNSFGKAAFSFGITFCRQVVLYIPFLLLFNFLWGYDGLIYAQMSEEAVCLILAVILIVWYLRREESRNRAI
ncbi:MAG: MATE family efflux transporter, partial [Coriobacteriales bacterium]|nr:MATE family efflux transporter [Coriobacteriales bacterium]